MAWHLGKYGSHPKIKRRAAIGRACGWRAQALWALPNHCRKVARARLGDRLLMQTSHAEIRTRAVTSLQLQDRLPCLPARAAPPPTRSGAWDAAGERQLGAVSPRFAAAPVPRLAQRTTATAAGWEPTRTKNALTDHALGCSVVNARGVSCSGAAFHLPCVSLAQSCWRRRLLASLGILEPPLQIDRMGRCDSRSKRRAAASSSHIRMGACCSLEGKARAPVAGVTCSCCRSLASAASPPCAGGDNTRAGGFNALWDVVEC